MEVNKILKEAQVLKDKGLQISNVVSYFSDRNLYHKLLIVVVNSVFDIGHKEAEKIVYANEYYKKFIIEENPFNDDLFNAIEEE